LAKVKISEADLLYAVWRQYQRVNTPVGLNAGYIWSRDDGYGWQAYQSPAGTDALVFTRRTFNGADSDLLTLTRNATLVIGGSVGVSYLRNILMLNGAAPTASTAGAILWAETGELKVRDQSGNVTTLSPHHLDQLPSIDPEDTLPVVVHHKNAYVGQEETIYLSKLARLVEQLTGETLIYKRTMPRAERRTYEQDEMNADLENKELQMQWDNHHAEIVALPGPDRARLLANLPPRPHDRATRPLPHWVRDRLPPE